MVYTEALPLESLLFDPEKNRPLKSELRTIEHGKVFKTGAWRQVGAGPSWQFLTSSHIQLLLVSCPGTHFSADSLHCIKWSTQKPFLLNRFSLNLKRTVMSCVQNNRASVQCFLNPKKMGDMESDDEGLFGSKRG